VTASAERPNGPPAPHYADDPEAPYFEHLFAVAQEFRPGLTRDELLAFLRESDPDDNLRIRDPQTDPGESPG
jgi:hypothetical protein